MLHQSEPRVAEDMESAAQLLGLCESAWDGVCGRRSRLLHLTLVHLHLVRNSRRALNQDPLVALISAIQHHLNEP